MTDFIIVGRGLAAAVLMHRFRQHGISFLAVGHRDLSLSSRVAAGIWNPVVFKRMTRSWLADQLIPELLDFYSNCERQMGCALLQQRDIVKPFSEEQEKRLWQKKAGLELSTFIDPEIHIQPDSTLGQFNIPNGYGRVLRAGNLDMVTFLDRTWDYFNGQVIDEVFDHSELREEENGLSYRGRLARNVIFCEGWLVKDNPAFNWLPLKPARGEVLSLGIPELAAGASIFNKDGFLMRVADGSFKAGATYSWDGLGDVTTAGGLEELSRKVMRMTACRFEVVRHEAGMRPSSPDRRPLIGRHPQKSSFYIFNGLGTKGVMLAPYFAKNFVHFFLQKQPLHADVNIARFYHLYVAHQ